MSWLIDMVFVVFISTRQKGMSCTGIWLHRQHVSVLKSHFSRRGWRVWGLNHSSCTTLYHTGLRKSNQNPVSYQRAFKEPFSAATLALSAISSHQNPLNLQTCSVLTHCYQSRLVHSHLSGYPESFCSDCPWMVPVASCGVTSASLWDKQPLRKAEQGQLLINVNSFPMTPRGAASHFIPEASWRKRSSLKAWVDGCFLMDRLRLTTMNITCKWWSQLTGRLCKLLLLHML